MCVCVCVCLNEGGGGGQSTLAHHFSFANHTICINPRPALPAGLSGCSIPASPGYLSNCAASLASGSTCVACSCAPSYTGSPSGSLTCKNGALSGSFSGCDGEWLKVVAAKIRVLAPQG